VSRWDSKPAENKVVGTPKMEWKDEDEEGIRKAAEEVLYGVTFLRVKR